jgi:hypothetical protein
VILIDGGATHNFIDSGLVRRLGLPTVDIGDFHVRVTGRHSLVYMRRVSHLELSMGNYKVTADFYVMDLEDTKMILGVQWLSTLGTICQNYETKKVEFRDAGGRRVVLRGMSNNAPQVAST